MRVPEISPSLRQALLGHDWPGNIRELENIMRKLLVFQDADMVCEDLQRTRRKTSIDAGPMPLANSNGMALAAAASAWGPASSGDLRPQIAGPDQPVNSEDPIQGLDQNPNVSASPHMLERVDQFKKNAEASVILSALKTTRWNRRHAANLLKIDYKALLYKMKKLGIND